MKCYEVYVTFEMKTVGKWPEESWVHIIYSFNICKIVKLWFNLNNGSYAKKVSERFG